MDICVEIKEVVQYRCTGYPAFYVRYLPGYQIQHPAWPDIRPTRLLMPDIRFEVMKVVQWRYMIFYVRSIRHGRISDTTDAGYLVCWTLDLDIGGTVGIAGYPALLCPVSVRISNVPDFADVLTGFQVYSQIFGHRSSM